MAKMSEQSFVDIINALVMEGVVKRNAKNEFDKPLSHEWGMKWMWCLNSAKAMEGLPVSELASMIMDGSCSPPTLEQIEEGYRSDYQDLPEDNKAKAANEYLNEVKQFWKLS